MALAEIKELDTKAISESYETQGDRIVKVLYGAKKKETTLERQDSTGF